MINSLRAASQVNERVEANAHLFLVTGDETILDKARGNAKNLEASVAHLKVLVRDNRNQDGSILAAYGLQRRTFAGSQGDADCSGAAGKRRA